MKIWQWKLAQISPAQPKDLFLVASPEGLMGLYDRPQKAPLASSLEATDDPESKPTLQILAATAQQLGEYFEGKRTEFQLPLKLEGTPFQKQVWDELLRIPYGETISYRDLARRIKNEKAIRAVGTANGRNPIWIIIPCHRVISSDGSLGGYAGGLPMKEQLLQQEARGLRG